MSDRPKTRKSFDADAILRELTELRQSIPRLDDETRSAAAKKRKSFEGKLQSATLEEFDQLAVADALEGLATELSIAIERANARMLEQALSAYYVAEELARDPQHPEMIPLVEEMRRAYEKKYGRPIP